MSTVRIVNGVYRNKPVQNVAFTLVKGFQTGAKGNYVTVDSDGYFGSEFDVVRIKVNGIEDVEFVDGETVTASQVVEKVAVPSESDEQAINRIRERFDILHEMTKACVGGDIRAMIVSGITN
jgi:hypothetical protein